MAETGSRKQEAGDRRPAMGPDVDRQARDRRAGMALGANIAERLLDFGLAVVSLVRALPDDRSGRHVAQQYLRAATSAGANYEEARAAESRADFIHKLSIAAKEMREACYWANLVHRSGWLERDPIDLVQEAQNLAAILGSSARTARARAEQAGVNR